MRLLHFPPFLLLLGLLPALVAYRFMPQATRPRLAVYLVRWLLGLVFVTSGLAKLIPGFPNTMGPLNLEATLAPHGLAPFARFVALSEVSVGLLLLTRRFATLGAVMLLPILTSILVVVVSLQWRGTPFVVAGFLALDLALVAYDYPTIAPLLGQRVALGAPTPVRAHAPQLLWLLSAVIVLLIVGLFRLESRDSLRILLVIGLLLGLVVADWRSASSAG